MTSKLLVGRFLPTLSYYYFNPHRYWAWLGFTATQEATIHYIGWEGKVVAISAILYQPAYDGGLHYESMAGQNLILLVTYQILQSSTEKHVKENGGINSF